MLVIVAKGRERELEEVFEKWDLHAARIGEVKEGDRMVVRHKGVVVADLPAKSLTDEAPVYDQPTSEPAHLASARDWKVDSIPRACSGRKLKVPCLDSSSTQQSRPKNGSGNSMIIWLCLDVRSNRGVMQEL